MTTFEILDSLKANSDDCWIWPGEIRTGVKRQYGSAYAYGKSQGVHRIAYQYWVGEIPKGLVVDHLCRTTLCVNPTHLEAVTQMENVLRGEGLAAVNAKKTHCIYGHEYTKENTQLDRSGHRHCKKCNLATNRRWYHREALKEGRISVRKIDDNQLRATQRESIK